MRGGFSSESQRNRDGDVPAGSGTFAVATGTRHPESTLATRDVRNRIGAAALAMTGGRTHAIGTGT